ncbi:MAG: biopolymer transporter ExbD [Phycisphaerales bacterium]|nr:biopolymer transporter ExbD [Phycisphaerales bacterium]
MNFKRTTDHHEIDFDLTAMIDVVFLLIIFFTFSTVFAKTVASPVDLPKESGEQSAAAAAAQTTLIVDVSKDGALSVSGMGTLRTDELLGTIATIRSKAAAAGRSVEMDVTIRADRACAARHVNQLVGNLARAGIRKWKLATSGEGGSGSGEGSGGNGGQGGAR